VDYHYRTRALVEVGFSGGIGSTVLGGKKRENLFFGKNKMAKNE